MTKNTVYQIKCCLCNEIYIGESGRPLHDRFYEHFRSASNPTAPSYEQKPLAKHYTKLHCGLAPKLELSILDTGLSLINRKIKESMYISRLKPQINEKDEQSKLKQFFVE